MTDSLGYRCKFAVIAPSTNTSVQPEYDWMRPHGVTNHFARITIPDLPVYNDADQMVLMNNIRGAMMETVDSVKTMSPDCLIMGMSAETFWDGLDGAEKLQARVEAAAGCKVIMGSDACQAALKAYGNVKRVAVVTPYMPIADAQVHKFFTDCGYEVAGIKGLRCASPMLISHTSEQTLRDAIIELDGEDVDAIVQVGTNLAMAKMAPMAEFWLGKPVIAINTATYWYALRQMGLKDQMQGFGKLLEEF
jgi:maleate isomerase